MNDYVDIHPSMETKPRKKGQRRKFYLNLSAYNGKIELTSQRYYSYWNAKRAAKKLAKDFLLTIRDYKDVLA